MPHPGEVPVRLAPSNTTVVWYDTTMPHPVVQNPLKGQSFEEVTMYQSLLVYSESAL